MCLFSLCVGVAMLVKKYRLRIEGVEMRPDELGISQWSVGQSYRLHYKGSRDVQPFILSVNGDLKVAMAYPGFLGDSFAMKDGALVLPPLAKGAAHIQGQVDEQRYFLVFPEPPSDSDEDWALWIQERQKDLSFHALKEGGKDATKDRTWHAQVLKSWAASFGERKQAPEVIVYTVER